MTDIIPVVPYEDIRAAHDWLVKVLGFTAGGVIEDGNGTVVHGEVQLGDRRIWLHASAAGLSTPNQSKAATGGVVVLVEDVDAHYAQAKAAGGDDPQRADRPGLRPARVRREGSRGSQLVDGDPVPDLALIHSPVAPAERRAPIVRRFAAPRDPRSDLDVVVERELVRVRAEPQHVDLVHALVLDVRLDEVAR